MSSSIKLSEAASINESSEIRRTSGQDEINDDVTTSVDFPNRANTNNTAIFDFSHNNNNNNNNEDSHIHNGNSFIPNSSSGSSQHLFPGTQFDPNFSSIPDSLSSSTIPESFSTSTVSSFSSFLSGSNYSPAHNNNNSNNNNNNNGAQLPQVQSQQATLPQLKTPARISNRRPSFSSKTPLQMVNTSANFQQFQTPLRRTPSSSILTSRRKGHTRSRSRLSADANGSAAIIPVAATTTATAAATAATAMMTLGPAVIPGNSNSNSNTKTSPAMASGSGINPFYTPPSFLSPRTDSPRHTPLQTPMSTVKPLGSHHHDNLQELPQAALSISPYMLTKEQTRFTPIRKDDNHHYHHLHQFDNQNERDEITAGMDDDFNRKTNGDNIFFPNHHKRMKSTVSLSSSFGENGNTGSNPDFFKAADLSLQLADKLMNNQNISDLANFPLLIDSENTETYSTNNNVNRQNSQDSDNNSSHAISQTYLLGNPAFLSRSRSSVNLSSNLLTPPSSTEAIMPPPQLIHHNSVPQLFDHHPNPQQTHHQHHDSIQSIPIAASFLPQQHHFTVPKSHNIIVSAPISPHNHVNNNLREEDDHTIPVEVVVDDIPKKEKKKKVHECPLCGGKFQRPEHVKRHMRSHSSEKPFVCGVCNKKFNRNDNMKAHERKIHGVGGKNRE